MEVGGQLHAQAALHLGKSFRYSLDRRLCGPQVRFGSYGTERKSPAAPMPGIEIRSSNS